MTIKTLSVSILFFISLIGASQSDFQPNYCPYTSSDVVRIVAKNVSQLPLMEKLIASYQQIDGSETVEWLNPRRIGSPGLYMTRCYMAEYLVVEARQQGLDADIVMHNVHRSLIDEKFVDPSIKHTRFLKGYQAARFTLSEYHPLDEINAYLDALHHEYGRVCEVTEIGQTTEGRTIRGLKIGTNPWSTPLILIDAALHAKEWLSTSTALFIATELITRYIGDPDIRFLVDNLTWYILPVVNVDGYEYSWTQDRKWLQNRSPPRVCIKERCLCRGTDLNRNWDSHWNTTGSCHHPCCESYPGPSAMSESEVQHESRLMESLKPRLSAYISLHQYGQLWTYPYNYEQKTYSDDVLELQRVARMAVKAVEALSGDKYQIGTGADLQSPSSGSSTDWAKANLSIKYTYSIKLYPPMIADQYGTGHYCPSSNVILPTAKGIFAGTRVVAEAVLGNHEKNTSSLAVASVAAGHATTSDNGASQCTGISSFVGLLILGGSVLVPLSTCRV